MWIHNGSKETICVGKTLEGPPSHKAMMMKPGDQLNISDVLPNLRIRFAWTPDGLRIAIYEEGLILPGGIHLN